VIRLGAAHAPRRSLGGHAPGYRPPAQPRRPDAADQTVAAHAGQPRRQLRSIVHEYKSEIRRRLRKLAREMGAREPEVLGDALRLLLEGGYHTRLVFSSGGPVSSIVKAVRALLDAHGVPALESG